jgi:hypothetical protein
LGDYLVCSLKNLKISGDHGSVVGARQMGARNFLEKPANPKAAYRRNQFGGTIGQKQALLLSQSPNLGADFDAAVQKDFRLFKEGHALQFRGELYARPSQFPESGDDRQLTEFRPDHCGAHAARNSACMRYSF